MVCPIEAKFSQPDGTLPPPLLSPPGTIAMLPLSLSRSLEQLDNSDPCSLTPTPHLRISATCPQEPCPARQQLRGQGWRWPWITESRADLMAAHTGRRYGIARGC